MVLMIELVLLFGVVYLFENGTVVGVYLVLMVCGL